MSRSFLRRTSKVLLTTGFLIAAQASAQSIDTTFTSD